MALTFSIQARGDIGGKEFRAVEVTCDGTAMTIHAGSIEMNHIDSAVVSPRNDLSSAASVNLGSIASLAANTSSIAVVGAALGDFTMQSMSVDCDDLTMASYVQAADAVEVVTSSLGATDATDLGDAVRRVRVVRHIGLSTLSGKFIVFQPTGESGDKFILWALGS